MSLTWSLPLELVNIANRREDRGTRAKRTKEQRGLACAMTNNLSELGKYKYFHSWHDLQFVVTITRSGPKRLDTDGLVISAKAVRDGISDALGLNDGDETKVKWSYEQKIGDYGVFVKIE